MPASVIWQTKTYPVYGTDPIVSLLFSLIQLRKQCGLNHLQDWQSHLQWEWNLELPFA